MKDRSVAVYLKKILSGTDRNNSKQYNGLDDSELIAEKIDESFRMQRNEFKTGLLDD